jgi:hypothetical protein
MVLAIINILVIIAIIFLLYKRADSKPLKSFLIPGISLKILAGILVGLIYKYHYGGGDTFNLFHDAVAYSEFALHSPTYFIQLLFEQDVPDSLRENFLYSNHPRSLIASKIFSFFSLITNNNYWISSMYLSLFSFSGMWYLANEITLRYPETKWAAGIGFLLFPSVVFWSSGVLKESLIMGSLCYLFGFILKNTPLRKKNFLRSSLFGILFIIILWQLKYYYLAAFLSVSITGITILLIRSKFTILDSKPLSLFILWIILFMLFLGASSQLYPTLQMDNFLFFLLDTHDTIYINSKPDNLIHYDNLNATFQSLLKNSPLALFSGLFRPGVWDKNSLLYILPTIENLFILISTVLVFRNIQKLSSPITRILIFSLIVYILLLAVLMAFAAPNFGTLMRYKVGYLPFLVYLVCINNPLLKFLKKGDT